MRWQAVPEGLTERKRVPGQVPKVRKGPDNGGNQNPEDQTDGFTCFSALSTHQGI